MILPLPFCKLPTSRLIKEYRYIPKILDSAAKAYNRDGLDKMLEKIPKRYKARAGNSQFFFWDKLGWLRKRYEGIVAALIKRRRLPHKKTYLEILAAFDSVPFELLNDWEVPRRAKEQAQEYLKTLDGKAMRHRMGALAALERKQQLKKEMNHVGTITEQRDTPEE